MESRPKSGKTHQPGTEISKCRGDARGAGRGGRNRAADRRAGPLRQGALPSRRGRAANPLHVHGLGAALRPQPRVHRVGRSELARTLSLDRAPEGCALRGSYPLARANPEQHESEGWRERGAARKRATGREGEGGRERALVEGGARCGGAGGPAASGRLPPLLWPPLPAWAPAAAVTASASATAAAAPVAPAARAAAQLEGRAAVARGPGPARVGPPAASARATVIQFEGAGRPPPV